MFFIVFFIVFCSVGLFVSASVGIAGDTDFPAHEKRPNIVLVMADDMGWGDTSYNQNPILKTPNLDQMAANGLRFNRFYSGSSVCSPTRGSCLTGRHPDRYGIFSANVGHLPTGEISLAEYLKTKGYRTGHFGKWHLGTLTKDFKDSNRGGPKSTAHFSPPDRHGFDTYFSTEAKVPTFDPLLKPLKSNRTAWLPVDRKTAALYGTRYFHDGKVVEEPLLGDDSGIIMNQALDFIKQKNDQPFCTVIWFHAPHLPVVANDADRQPYRHLDLHSQSYFGCMAALDREVGRLRQLLREKGISENTLVCFCSDNGPEGNNKSPGSARDLRGRKRSLYEGGIRVPSIMEWPGKIKKGHDTNFPAFTSDYFPTIVEATGGTLSDDREYDGVSLMPLIQAEKTAERSKPLFFQYGNQAAMIDGELKLYCRLKNSRGAIKSSELYNLRTDPSESKDIAASHPDQVKKMLIRLKDWRQSCRKSLNGGDYSDSTNQKNR